MTKLCDNTRCRNQVWSGQDLCPDCELKLKERRYNEMTLREKITDIIRSFKNKPDSLWSFQVADAILSAITEALPKEKEVNWNDLGSTQAVAKQSEAHGYNTYREDFKEILK